GGGGDPVGRQGDQRARSTSIARGRRRRDQHPIAPATPTDTSRFGPERKSPFPPLQVRLAKHAVVEGRTQVSDSDGRKASGKVRRHQVSNGRAEERSYSRKLCSRRGKKGGVPFRC